MADEEAKLKAVADLLINSKYLGSESCIELRDEDLEELVMTDWVIFKGNLRIYGCNIDHSEITGLEMNRCVIKDTTFQYSILTEGTISNTTIIDCDFSYADCIGVDFTGSKFSDNCKMEGIKLARAKLRGTKLPKGFYQVADIGSRRDVTTYDVINDQVICGCWDNQNGNNLEDFIKVIEETYGAEGNKANEIYYQEYMNAIEFFKKMKKLYEENN